MMSHVMRKAPEQEVGYRAIRTEILGYHHLVLCPRDVHFTVCRRQRKDGRLIHMC